MSSLLRQKWREQTAVAARHGIPANGTVDLGKFHEDLEARRQIELQPSVTPRDKHAIDAGPFQRFNNIRRDSSRRLDLRCARRDGRS